MESSLLDEQDLTKNSEDDSLKDDRQINGKDVSFKPILYSIHLQRTHLLNIFINFSQQESYMTLKGSENGADSSVKYLGIFHDIFMIIVQLKYIFLLSYGVFRCSQH